MQLKAKKDGKGNIFISESSFEHLLNCLANQKFIGEPPPNGDAAALGAARYKSVQEEMQQSIDDFYHQCRNFLNG